MKKRNQNIVSKGMSVFIAGMYLFVVLFSSQLHHHNNGSDGVSLVDKTELRFSKSDSHIQDPTDCFSCHFLANHNVLLPEEFVFLVERHTQETEQIFSVQNVIWDNSKLNYPLRGPPYFS